MRRKAPVSAALTSGRRSSQNAQTKKNNTVKLGNGRLKSVETVGGDCGDSKANVSYRPVNNGAPPLSVWGFYWSQITSPPFVCPATPSRQNRLFFFTEFNQPELGFTEFWSGSLGSGKVFIGSGFSQKGGLHTIVLISHFYSTFTEFCSFANEEVQTTKPDLINLRILDFGTFTKF